MNVMEGKTLTNYVNMNVMEGKVCEHQCKNDRHVDNVNTDQLCGVLVTVLCLC